MHTGGQKPFVDALPAHTAFFNVAFGFVVARRTKRTVPQTVATANADIFVMDDNAILTLGVGTNRAAFEAGRLGTVITCQRIEGAVFVRVNLFAEWIHLAPDHAGL